MNEWVSSSKQAMIRSDNVSHRQDLLRAIIGSSEVIPLDNAGHFSLIRTEHYREFVATIEEGKQAKEQLQQQCHRLTIANAQLAKEREYCYSELSQFKQNETKFQQTIDKITKTLKQTQIKLIQTETKLKQSQLRTFSKQSKILLPKKPERQILTSSTGVQTQYESLINQQQSEKKMIQQVSEQMVTNEQSKIYQIMKNNLSKFTNKFEEKLNRLEECQLQLDQWEQQKQVFKQQNQRLRVELRAREVEEEKLRIWQHNISQLVNRVENNITSPPEYKKPERIGDNWEEAAQLRAKLAEFRIRLRNVENEMRVQDEVEEEGAVVTLVRLTQKVRAVIQGILVQVNCPPQ